MSKRADYTVDGSALLLTGDFPALFIRTEPVAGRTDAGTIRFGCFDRGAFVERPITELDGVDR